MRDKLASGARDELMDSFFWLTERLVDRMSGYWKLCLVAYCLFDC